MSFRRGVKAVTTDPLVVREGQRLARTTGRSDWEDQADTRRQNLIQRMVAYRAKAGTDRGRTRGRRVRAITLADPTRD